MSWLQLYVTLWFPFVNQRQQDLMPPIKHILYPTSFCLQVIDDFMDIHGAKWRAVTADSTEATALLEPALVKYQVRIADRHTALTPRAHGIS